MDAKRKYDGLILAARPGVRQSSSVEGGGEGHSWPSQRKINAAESTAGSSKIRDGAVILACSSRRAIVFMPHSSRSAAAGDASPPGEGEALLPGLTSLHAILRTITSEVQPEMVWQRVLEQVNRVAAPAAVALLLAEPDSGTFRTVLASGPMAAALREWTPPLADGLPGTVLRSGEALLTDVTAAAVPEPAWCALWPAERFGVLRLLPVRAAEGPLGVLMLAWTQGLQPAPDPWKRLETVAECAGIALANARSFTRLGELIITDDCTGLYNSRYLFQVLETEIHRSERFAYPFSFLFLDLDHFKMVNDQHGHLVGSRLLRLFGDWLRQYLRKNDYVFRYGGDEFAVLLPQTSKDQGLVVARRLLTHMRAARFPAGSADQPLALQLTVSIGMVTFPEDAATKEHIVRFADAMMYRVKQRSRDDIAVPEPGDSA